MLTLVESYSTCGVWLSIKEKRPHLIQNSTLNFDFYDWRILNRVVFTLEFTGYHKNLSDISWHDLKKVFGRFVGWLLTRFNRNMCACLNLSINLLYWQPIMLLFTDSVLWAGSVIESPCPSVCLYVTKVVIVDNGQSIRFFVFLHKLEWVGMVLRILNLEGHKIAWSVQKLRRFYKFFSSMII